MDVFQLLEEQHHVIYEDLVELLHGSNLEASEAVARSGQLFGAVRKHFDNQERLLFRKLEHRPELRTMLEAFRADRAEIIDDIDEIVLWHVDEPGYANMLKMILNAVRHHMTVAEEQIFPKLREHMPQTELAKINHAVRELIFI